MASSKDIGRQDYLTFRGNLRKTRYGWLRLTPAYSIHQVEELLGPAGPEDAVLDPFCGTGTTALVCAERGIPCDTTEINPFLVWLAAAKAATYSGAEVDEFKAAAARVAAVIRSSSDSPAWVPPLHQIEKWWDRPTLAALSQAMAALKAWDGDGPGKACDLLKIAFCRTMMEHAHVSFGHQSMSFKKRQPPQRPTPFLPGFEDHPVAATWEDMVATIAAAARSPVACKPRILLHDARNLGTGLEAECYTYIVTSPPYPNRMSYIRELRPYMYWLGFLKDGRAAGEMDWQAIGGTWGCATSNLAKWQPELEQAVPYAGLEALLRRIARTSEVLARYVQKYFVDMVRHATGLFPCVRPGGKLFYVVGNSKFYDVLLPVEEIFVALFESAGFSKASARKTRKRTSKKELFEFVVSARRPIPASALNGDRR